MFKRVTRMVVLAMVAMVVCAAAASAGGYASFPPDPKGVKVIDRASYDVYMENSGTWYFYAIVYNTKQNGVMKIYSTFEKQEGTSIPKWKEIYNWKMSFEGENVKLQDIEILGIAQNDPEVPVVTFWTDSYVGYVEGDVHLGLNYDINNNTFTQDWSD